MTKKNGICLKNQNLLQSIRVSIEIVGTCIVSSLHSSGHKIPVHLISIILMNKINHCI